MSLRIDGRIETYNNWICLYCQKRNKNVAFCSYDCKQNHYNKKRRELKGE